MLVDLFFMWLVSIWVSATTRLFNGNEIGLFLIYKLIKVSACHHLIKTTLPMATLSALWTLIA